MPVVLRVDGFTVRIRTHDHTPPHVHLFYGGEEIVINLGGESTVPQIRDYRGMSARHARRALDIVSANGRFLLEKWHEIHT